MHQSIFFLLSLDVTSESSSTHLNLPLLVDCHLYIRWNLFTISDKAQHVLAFLFKLWLLEYLIIYNIIVSRWQPMSYPLTCVRGRSCLQIVPHGRYYDQCLDTFHFSILWMTSLQNANAVLMCYGVSNQLEQVKEICEQTLICWHFSDFWKIDLNLTARSLTLNDFFFLVKRIKSEYCIKSNFRRSRILENFPRAFLTDVCIDR